MDIFGPHVRRWCSLVGSTRTLTRSTFNTPSRPFRPSLSLSPTSLKDSNNRRVDNTIMTSFLCLLIDFLISQSLLYLSLSLSIDIYIYFIESHHPSLCGSSSVKILLYKELKKDNLFECKWIQMNLFSFPPLPSPSLSPVVSKLSLLKHKESRSFYMFPSLHSFVIARKKKSRQRPNNHILITCCLS